MSFWKTLLYSFGLRAYCYWLALLKLYKISTTYQDTSITHFYHNDLTMVIFWETSTALFLFWGSNSLPKGVLSILGSFPLPRYPSTSTGWGQDLHAVKEQVKERGREEEHGESVISRGSDSGDTLRCNVRPTCPGSRRKFAAWLISISQLSWTAGTAVYVHKRLVLTSSWYICKNILFQTLMLFL